MCVCVCVCVSVRVRVPPESSAVKLSVSPYSNSRFGDSMDPCVSEANNNCTATTEKSNILERLPTAISGLSTISAACDFPRNYANSARSHYSSTSMTIA